RVVRSAEAHQPRQPAGDPAPAPPASEPESAADSPDSEPETDDDPGGLGPSNAVIPRLPPDEAEKARGMVIAEINVAGNRRISTRDVKSYLRERVGETFQPEELTADVRELYNSGFFDDIQVDLRRTDSGVALRFFVRERPNVMSVEFEGNQVIDSEDLTEAIEVKTNTILSRPAIRRTIQKIRDMYAEQGYFLAEAESEVIPQQNNEVTVKFKITEHNQVSVRRITFIGNEAISTDELRASGLPGDPGVGAVGSGGPVRQDAVGLDVAGISGLVYDRGFMQVSINTPRIMLAPDRGGIETSVTINEGPRFRIRQLRVYERGPDGEEVEPIGGRRALRMMIRAESGDYFNRAELLEDLAAIRTMYRDEGFANVEGNPETKLDAKRREVDIVVPIVRGPPVTFERIEMRGNTKTRDRVIRRALEIAEGELFSETKLENSRRRVTALGYFERVDVSTEQGSEPDKMVVYFEVGERPTGTFQVGAGFSSIENFIATAQIQQANLFGNGQSLSLQAQVSGLRQLINLRLIEPYFLESRFTLSIDLFDQLRRYTDFSQRSRGGALSLGYPLIEPELRASLTYTLTLDEVSTTPQ